MMKRGLSLRRFLACILSLAMVFTMAPVPGLAEEGSTTATSSVWKSIALTDITPEDAIAISMMTPDGTTYVLPNAEASSTGPDAIQAAVSSDRLTIAGPAKDYTWNISGDNEAGYKITSPAGLHLYGTAANNGIRVGSTDMLWKLDGNYLTYVDTKEATRYLGIYTTKPDWRAYNSPTTNVKDQTVGFWKLADEEAGGEESSAEEADIEKFTVSATYDGVLTAGVTMTLQCGTISDATYEISTDGTAFTGIEGNTYTIPEGEDGSYELSIRGVKDGHYSKTLTLSYKIGQKATVTIAQARALAKDAEACVQGTVTYISGKNIYVQDATGGICLYFSTAPSGLKVGDLIQASGVRASYNGLEELTNVTEYEKLGTGEFSVKSLTLAELLADYAADNLYECTRVKIENLTLGEILTSGNTAATDAAGNSINIYRASALSAYKQGDVVTVTATVGDYKGYQLMVLSAEDITLVTAAPEETESSGESETESGPAEEDSLPATIKDGTYVIWNPNYQKTFANLFNGQGYMIGDTVSGDLNAVSGYSNVSVWNVKAVEGGYTFEQNGLYAGTTSANKLAVSDAPANKVWTVKLTADGKHYNLSAGGRYLEWYASYSDWSMYSSIGAGSENMFDIWFTPASQVYDVNEDMTMKIAQWGGGGPYGDNITAINGDTFEVGDQKDFGAVYTAVVGGSPVKPYTISTPSTGGTSYYMGGTGLGSGSNDFIQLQFSSAGYGKMSMSFRLRASNTGPGEFQLQYSTDGVHFENFTTGSYECAYTDYSTGTGTPAVLSGAITDGIARTSIKATYYVSFKFDIPAGAENADDLYVRMVPSSAVNAKGAESKPSTGGTLRVDNVVVEGSPIVDSSITAFTVVDPDGREEDQAPGTELTMTTDTEGAKILYRFLDPKGEGTEEWLTYDETAKPVLPATLPAYLQVKANAEGRKESITRLFKYAAGSVAAVKFTPNGGGVFIPGEEDTVTITLSCDTEGATILYNTDGSDNYAEYSEDAPIVLKKGFGSFTVQAYAVKEGFNDSPVSTRKFTERDQENYNIYFGQLHSHTSYSDGAGSAKDAFEHASKVKNLDFLAVTDHSNSFDNAGSSVLAEDASRISEEWKEGKQLAKAISDDDFTGLFGFEMTWSNGLGHMNTFNTPGFQSRTQSEYTTYSTALQNYYAALKTVSDSVSQFNHPGTTFGDFSDFAYFDTELDPLITLIEVGNGEGAIGSSSYFPSYEYYTRALDKGWHVAPTNNQDNHKGLWGDANTARSVVLSDSLDEDAIYDAMRNYRVYATEDNDLSIYYTLDDNIMGTILGKNDVGSEVTLKANISDPTDAKIGKVDVIVNGGLSIASKTMDSASGQVSFAVGADYSYYYLRITQPDGDIAVTAPVWVGEVEAVGISEFKTSTPLPVQNEELDLNVSLYNNETKPLEVNKVEFTVMNADDETQTIKTLEGDALAEAGLAKIPKLGTADYSFNYKYEGLGNTVYSVIVTAMLDGVEKVYTEKLDLNYVSKDMVTNVVIDGSHYNDYVTGYYGGNMANFTKLAADESVKVTIAGDDKDPANRALTENEWKALLEDCALLVVSAPARTSGTANAGDYKAGDWEDWFVTLVADFAKKGGSVVICGLADYQDTKAVDKDHHAAAQLNKLLSAMGSSMKINDDEVIDAEHNGGQPYRLYPENFAAGSDAAKQWLAGMVTKEDNAENYQKYSQYSGCTVDPGNGTSLVKGFDTTWGADSDKDGVRTTGQSFSYEYSGKNYTYDATTPMGDVTFMAVEDTEAGGHIFAAGGVFLSDFEVKAELDNIYDLPYANATIARNILAAVKVELPVSPVAEVRKAANEGNSGSVYRVQGTVTVGRANENNAFFDCIYLQDETAGIDIFPISDDSIKVGAKIEITGYIAEYQGDLELKVMSYKLLDNEDLNPVEPTKLTCAEASDYAKNGGLLTSVTGTVKEGSLYYNADGTLAQFVVSDETGDTTIFIDGYILSGTKGTNTLADSVKAGARVTAVGVQYMHPEVFIPGATGNVSVLRVRDCDEIVAEEAPEETESSSEVESPEETESSSEIESPEETESSSEIESPEETESSSEIESPEETESSSTPTKPTAPTETVKPTKPSTTETTAQPVLKKATIKASGKTRVTGTKKTYYTVKATTNSNARLTFKSSSSKVTVGAKTGKVTIPAYFVGKVTITIKTAKTKKFKAASKKITLKVIPRSTKIKALTNPSKGKQKVRWYRRKKITGYQIQTTKMTNFSKPRMRTVKGYKNLSTTFKKMFKKKYRTRVRTYKVVNGVKYFSKWSPVKTIKIKKPYK